MITSEGNAPVIYAGNEKIARRHINASLLARFFDPSAVETEAAVFRSLKGTAEFFEGEGDQTLVAFEDWLDEEIFADSSSTLEQLGALLPGALGEGRSSDWEVALVRDAATEFLSELQELQAKTEWEEQSTEDDDLLSVFSMQPSFRRSRSRLTDAGRLRRARK